MDSQATFHRFPPHIGSLFDKVQATISYQNFF